jgi:hypothetical protein
MTAPKLLGNRCQCTACGEYFSSARSFDRHRVGDFAEPRQPHGTRRCVPAADLLANGWSRNARGFLQEPHAGRAPADIAGPRSITARVRQGGDYARA